MTTTSLKADAIRGGIAGAVATVGMTAAMVWLHRRLPRRQQYGLPPEQIVDDVLDRVDASDKLTTAQFKTVSMVAHHGYGTAMGTVYGLLAPYIRSNNPAASGACFGMVVWAASYLGWLPAMRMRASASHEPKERNGLTIATHLIWGALTGILAKRTPSASTNGRAAESELPDFIGGDNTHIGGESSRCPFHAFQPQQVLQRLGNR